MPKPLMSPDHLFDRTWRPGHPFRPRIGRLRRWVMGFLFFLLCTVIGGYLYITDATRVRGMAESYLSILLGGPVQVGRANLSIFQGLRLDDVRLYAEAPDAPDSLLFSAQSFLIQVDLKALLTGRLEASRIVAVEPRVHVVEDALTGKRNYNRLLESHGPTSMPSVPGSNLTLPEIVLRNAQILYSRHSGTRITESSSIGIEGQLTPIPSSKIYRFSLQSHGTTTDIGPVISGEIVMGTGQVTASLQNFEFGTDLKTMLPPEVRQWWEQHGLSGRVNIPVLNFIPPAGPNDSAGYRVEIELQGVTLAVHPREWMGANEHRMLDQMHDALDALRLAGLNSRKFVDRVSELVEPAPISLRQVHGRFVFTDDQMIQIQDLHGWLEELPFKISGKIKGYSPEAEAQIRVASSDLQDIEIPAAPRYLNSLPPAVREIYDRFKPRGICRFWVELNRATAGARPVVTGQIDIVDGNFTFERFPYPLRKTNGRIVLGQNPRTGEESLTLDRIRGRGQEGGPNADKFIEVNGAIGPFGPDAQVDITVTGDDISSDPGLMAAFPPMTHRAMTLFDAPGKGEFPKFIGAFECKIIRLRGNESRWIIDTDIHLKDAAGSLVAFPYPMTGVNGELKIHDDFIELIGIGMKKDDASLRIDGRVSWPSSNQPRRPNDGPSLKPNLKIVATNVPLDADLIGALPAGRREWLKTVGAGGKFDLDGTIRPASNPDDDLDYDLHVALHDGTLWPVNGVPSVDNLMGNMRLTNQRITLADMRGRRGDADVSARGEIAWPNDIPRVSISAQASNLSMDRSLYNSLPASAKNAWDQVQPNGTVDVSLNYSGVVGDDKKAAATQPAGGSYELSITPRNLSATPQAVPYRLDQLAGTVTVLPDRVVLKSLTAKHGDARIKIDGSGSTGPTQTWDFTLGGEAVPVDDDLKKAVPGPVADLFKSMSLDGKVNFDFNTLHVVIPKSASLSPTSKASEVSPDIDFGLRLTTDAASFDVGVPISDAKGTIALAGGSRNGKLTNLVGKIDLDSMTLAGRSVTGFSAEMVKQADQNLISLGKMQAHLARGTMAGQIDYRFFDANPSQYRVTLQLRGADVKELAGETEQEINGQVSASLDLDGTADQPNSRRGRGDVMVAGQRMYRIPLVLGLLQITNLSLPINSPFTEATARYSIDGAKVTFEQIELRSAQMLMQGDGNLDFNTRQVKMHFATDSTTWPRLPVIGELISGARSELLQIQVRGTLQEPHVSARSMNTLSTTVDEVLGGDGKTPIPTTQSASGR